MFSRFAAAIGKKIRLILTQGREAEMKKNKLNKLITRVGNTQKIMLDCAQAEF